MKNFSIIFLIFACLLFCGFKKSQKPYILMSSGTVNEQNLQRVQRVFPVGQKINYVLVFPDGVKYSGIRVHVSTQSDKVTNFGFSKISANDIYISKGDNIYRDYFIPKTTGHYILQFFYLNKKNYPFIHVEFVVK